MSETASNPRADLSVPDPTQVQVPAQLWLRSGRPMFGTAVRVYVAFAFIAGGLIFVPRGPALWGMLGAGLLAFVLFPLVIQGLLAPLERRVLAAGRREATPLLQEVRARGLVRRFAPHAWLTLQEGRLHLRRGDGRAAARAFTETLRLSRSADTPALISAQAQALVIAEQPEQARELLQALGRRQALSAGDQLTLGLALLGTKGSGREALAHIQAAQAGLGDLPRVLAALALALHRADQAEAGLVALQQAQDSLGADPDPFDEALVQRGVKLLRNVQKAHDRRERKSQNQGKRAEGVARVAVPAAAPVKIGSEDPASPAKSARKAKKDERRASRRAAKAERRTVGVEAPVKANKAAKVAPKGKAAKAVAPHKLKAAPVMQEPVKPVKVAQETGAKAAAPVVQEPVKPVKVSQETGVKAAAPVVQEPVTPVKVAQETGATAAAPAVQEPVKPVKVSQETGAAAAMPEPVKPVVQSQEAGAKAAAAAMPEPVKPVVQSQETGVKAAAPVVQSQETGAKAAVPVVPEPVKPVVQSQEAGAKPVGPSAPPRPPTSLPGARPEAPRAPAPPSGAALFGSVAAKPSSGPAPAFGAPPSGLRLPPRPVQGASGPQPSSVAPPAATVRPPTPVASPAVPGAMSPVSAPAVNPSAFAGAPPTGAVPVPSPVPSPVVVRAPVAPSLGAPSLVMPAPPTFGAPTPSLVMPVPVAPSLPGPPQVQAPALMAPVLISQPGPTARLGDAPPPGLAQVLPDTDDGWDDMLDALEADNTRR